MTGKFFNFVYALNLIIQSAFTFLVPAGIFIGAAYCLNRYCSVGKWIFIPFIIIGVLSGVYSLFRYAVLATSRMPVAKEKETAKDDKAKDDKKDNESK